MYEFCTNKLNNHTFHEMCQNICMLYSGIEYRLGKAGSLCSDKGFKIITSIDECHKSFKSIKLMYPDAKNKVDVDGVWHRFGYIDRPKGCFYNLQFNSLFWNSDKKGGPNKDDRQVCYAKGNFFILNTLQSGGNVLLTKKYLYIRIKVLYFVFYRWGRFKGGNESQ